MRLGIILLLPLLAACATNDNAVWFRTDGQTMVGRLELIRAFERDVTVCQGEVAKVDAGSVAPLPRRQRAADDVMAGCMAQRGYVLRQR